MTTASPDIPDETDELTRLWPEQVISNHAYWFQAWRTTQKGSIKPGTEIHFSTIGKLWAQFADGKNLTPRLMLDWHLYALERKNTFGQPIHIGRVGVYHYVIRKYMRWLFHCNIIKADPAKFLPPIKVPPHQPPKAWSHEEYTRITTWAELKPKYQLPLWLFVLGYHTGMSLIDCCYLKWSEVTLSPTGPCKIERIRTKLLHRGARGLCVIPILVGGELWRWLKRLEADKPPDAEYVHREAPIVYAQQDRDLRRRIVRMKAEALGQRTIKSFRHLRNSFASRMVNSGADSVLVSKMTGHTNPRQLAQYVIADIRTMQEAVLTANRWAEHQSIPPEPPPNCITLPPPAVSPKEELPASSGQDPRGAALPNTQNNQ